MEESGWDGLVADLFDGDVTAGACAIDAHPAGLLADELTAVARASDGRKAEFAAGRRCARRLLSRLGVGEPSLPVDGGGRPRWPAGVVGSIAHAGGVCVAAVARRQRVAALGIDVEVAAGLDESLWPEVCTTGELDWLRRRRRTDPVAAALLATMLFSIKESAYKCRPPRAGGAFEPGAIAVDWDGVAPAFAARPCAGGAETVRGRVLLRRGWILSGARDCPGRTEVVAMPPRNGG